MASIGTNGTRPRLLHERVEKDTRDSSGTPIVFDEIPPETRQKIAEWVLRVFVPDDALRQSVWEWLRRTTGKPIAEGNGFWNVLSTFISTCSVLELWSVVEASLVVAHDDATSVYPTVDGRQPQILRQQVLQFDVFLGDECIGYRVHDRTGRGESLPYEVVRIDSEVLHREVVDRAFELTRKAEFASTSRDYSEAWRHYSKGAFADAITNAGKALESAEKTLLRKLAPGISVDLVQSKLAHALSEHGVFPTKLQTLQQQLRTILEQGPTTVRNQPGHAHGSADLQSPEAALALLVLNLVGSLVVFLIQAYERR